MPTYCLNCRKPNICKCADPSKRFHYSDKLRVPTSVKNKERFRQFLRDCPIFVNCVPEHLHEEFRQLLKDIKYKDGIINGRVWTKI